LRKVLAPVFVEQLGDPHQVEHEVPDRNSGAAAALADREDSERQVLYREVAPLSAFDPARPRWIEGFVGHGSFALGKPAHAMS
jgi:hypothetical protein